MKRHLSLFFVLTVSVLVFSQTAVEPALYEGKYQIASLENLYWIAAPDSVVPTPSTTVRWSANYVQLNDINAAPTHTWFPDGSGGYYGWVPIASGSLFSGTYNGRGFGIDSLYANRNTAGLFDVISGSHVNISGIKLTNVSITSTNYAGGIASQSLYRSVIENCSVSGSIFGNFKVGGITGYSDTSSISWCSVSGSVSGGIFVGGITGEITDSTGDTGSQIYNCYSTAAVSGDSRVGGLVAQIGSLSLITNSYSSGAVSCSDSYVGGLAWSNMYIVTDSFWDVESSGQTSSAGGTGKTRAEMKTESTFTNAGWDFTSVWLIDPLLNSGYPDLQWQYPPPASPEVLLSYSTTPELSWNEVSGATSYKIYSSTNPNAIFPTGWTLETTVTELSWTDSDTSGTRKFYVVVAVN